MDRRPTEQRDPLDEPTSFPIRELLSPAAFTHPVTQLELVETHISWVVLTGALAYKIKKSVRLDFIDTSSLERRRECCLEEVRLNRRLAADLYLGVVAIVRTRDGLRVDDIDQTLSTDDPHSTVLEYAVCMRQFARSDELGTLLDMGAVDCDQMAALGERLARFHLSVSTEKPNLGSYDERIRAAVVENLTELQTAARSDPDPRLYSLAAWTHAALEKTMERLRQREANGHVLECHGDLHAHNIVRWQGTLTPFDSIEFNPNLRWIDTLDDVGFLYMDLLDRNRSDLATVLLNRYLEITGDYDGMPLLPLYAVYRALVRARVDALSERQQPDKAAQYRRRLRSRIGTAHAMIQPRPRALIVMHGASGSGKSWLSERLVPEIQAIRIRSDIERKRLAGVSSETSPAERREQDIYTPEFTTQTYDRLLESAANCLEGNCNVIVDAAFLKVAERRKFRALAAQLNAVYVVLSCTASRELMTERIRKRQVQHTDPSDADVAVLDRQLSDWAGLDKDEQAFAVVANTEAAEIVAFTSRAIHERTRTRVSQGTRTTP